MIVTCICVKRFNLTRLYCSEDHILKNRVKYSTIYNALYSQNKPLFIDCYGPQKSNFPFSLASDIRDLLNFPVYGVKISYFLQPYTPRRGKPIVVARYIKGSLQCCRRLRVVPVL